MNDWVAIALLVILLAGNAFFVAGEFAIMSTRRAQIEPLAEEGNKRAQTVIYALENVSLMLATCQLGITICSLLILNVSEPALHHMLEVPLHLVGLPHAIVDVIAFGITLILVTYLHVKDALAIAPERFEEPFPWYKLRSLDTLTPTTDIDDALASMQRSRTHIAQVMDEHGTTLGVVFLEDVLEELVGEINDTTQDAVRERVRRQQSREAQ